MNKKALIVSPYLDHLGGGERYMLAVGSALENLGYELYFGWDNLTEINHLASMLGIGLRQPQLDPVIKTLYLHHNPFSMFMATRPYDIVFYLSDGSLPLLGGKRNLVHMQVPFHGVEGKSLKNKIKKTFIDHVVVNSNFTKQVVDKEYGISSTVLYPPVAPVSPGVKDNIILSVGRFDPSLNTKHQDVLIEAFKHLSPQLLDWKLILVGGSSSDEWVSKLKQLAVGLPVEFIVNATYHELCTMYSRAKIYWHAAGYGVDEVKNPELTEHFGISTVEAISAGCIPLVVPYGGQKEILADQQYHWTTTKELVDKTIDLVKATGSYTIDLTKYSVDTFNAELKKLL